MKELISGGFLKVDKGFGVVSEKFRDILILEEPFVVNTPLDRLRANLPMIDRLDCLELLLLKIASVIGDVFDVQTLYRI